MLIDGEEDLGNLGFWVDFKFLFDVFSFACKYNCAAGGILDDVWFSGYQQLKAQCNLVVVFLLLFKFGVHIKKQFI